MKKQIAAALSCITVLSGSSMQLQSAAHQQDSEPRKAGIVRAEIMSLDGQRRMPHAPDDAACDDCQRSVPYSFQLRIQIAAPAVLLTEGVERQKR